MGRGSGGQQNQATRSQELHKQSRSRMGNGMNSRVVARSTLRGAGSSLVDGERGWGLVTRGHREGEEAHCRQPVSGGEARRACPSGERRGDKGTKTLAVGGNSIAHG